MLTYADVCGGSRDRGVCSLSATVSSLYYWGNLLLVYFTAGVPRAAAYAAAAETEVLSVSDSIFSFV